MEHSKLLFLLFLSLLITPPTTQTAPKTSALFGEYIGAEFNNVKLSDVPINPNVDFRFILSFAIDYTNPSSPANGHFNVFFDSDNLSPSEVSSIKNNHPNVKVALALGGDSIGKEFVFFDPLSINSWVSNAVTSLTKIIKNYHLDGIDIDYEHFKSNPNTFAECIGRLITILKKNKVISFASIAPFDDVQVQKHYLALWRSYGNVIDYVNFQFYAYDLGISVSQFLKFFEEQSRNYEGGKVLVGFISDGSGGLPPEKGFFTACNKLKREKKLHGIFVWSADVSKDGGFRYEKQSQALLDAP